MNEENRKSDIAKKEEEILAFWDKNNIFNKTLEKDAPEGEFVFYEGPPTANGRPGIHHLESRSFKDAIPRYKTMRGFHVRRKAGWDTHGLPVEIEVEKELGITSKPDIEKYGIEAFNEKCKESVWKYVEEWERFTKRVGYWVDLDNPYITYKPEYMESVWNIFSHINDRGLVYKDYKVLPWCPRCGTALSSHELAQGYSDVKDLSVTSRFKLKKEFKGKKDVSILAWTTTPWTLPGNIALAIGKDIEYGIYKVGEGDTLEYVVIANDLAEQVFADVSYSKEEDVSASDLLGLSYEPLYPYMQDLADVEGMEKAYKIYPADFVTTEDGTGVVHTAVMYGQDDFVLGSEIGLPKFHLVDEEGHFVKGTDFLENMFVKDEETDVSIIKDLAHRGLLFSKAKYEHTYPHCWRCKTPLIYYARDSWYIRMSDLQDELIEENEKINWEPAHLKEGRFGEWLRGVRDWAISRDRYWGTPLPIWENEDGSKRVVIGSVEELKEKTKSSNKYMVMRHCEARHNVENVINVTNNSPSHLTDKGKKGAEKTAEEMDKVDIIFHSPLIRGKETAEIIAKEHGVEEIYEDIRLREIDFGDLDGESIKKYWEFTKDTEGYGYATPIPGGESFMDVKKRVGKFLYEIDKKYKNKKILIVGHGATLEVFPAILEGADELRSFEILNKYHYEGHTPGTLEEYTFSPIPHNKDFELDLHKPYIDEITWEEDGEIMKRTPEVMDVWFDSGAMPFAQDHYPFDFAQGRPSEGRELSYPADFISEAIDQTRGWFYTLHAIGVLMGKGNAYKNIISLGHLLDSEGQKMSKSKGNTVDPWEASDKFGVDALRFWMYSINQPGESKNFDPKTVDEIIKKVFNILRNVVRFWEMYKEEDLSGVDPYTSPHVLDIWVLARLNELIVRTTNSIDSYNLIDPIREIRDFIGDDLSRWYIRRTRDRFKGEDTRDKKYALATTRFVLLELSKLMAPFTPFIAEEVYQEISNDKESVHLESWPKSKDYNDSLLEMMHMSREIVSLALDKRTEEGIKVRQPLAVLYVNSSKYDFSDSSYKKDLFQQICEEVNVKELVEEDMEEDVRLDIEITPDLQNEGYIRELIRAIQGLRKDLNLSPEDRVVLSVDAGDETRSLIEKNTKDISSVAGISDYNFSTLEEGQEVELGDEVVKIKIQ